MFIQLPSALDALIDPVAQPPRPELVECTTLTVAPAPRAHRWAEGKLKLPALAPDPRRWQARVQVHPPGAEAGPTAWTAQPSPV